MYTSEQNNGWDDLSTHAWATRENAFILGNTKVGAALLTTRGNIISGCNVEHNFRCHDVHAEVNAISNMITSGNYLFDRILIVADRDLFTPCGSCMDWIMQFSTKDVLIGFQSQPNNTIQIFTAEELMPFYPR